MPDLARDFWLAPWETVAAELLTCTDVPANRDAAHGRQGEQIVHTPPSPCSRSGEDSDSARSSSDPGGLRQLGLLVPASSDPTRLHVHPCVELGLRHHAASRTRESCEPQEAAAAARARCINMALTYLANKLCLASRLHAHRQSALVLSLGLDRSLLRFMLRCADDASQAGIAMPVVLLVVWESMSVLQFCLAPAELQQLLSACLAMCEHLDDDHWLAKVRDECHCRV